MHASDHQSRSPICSWPDSDRPRRRIQTRGVAALSSAELIAAIIGTGTRTVDGPMSAVQLGLRIVSRFQTLRELAAVEPEELRAMPGMGPAKCAQLVAAFELGRRVAETTEAARIVVRGPEDVVTHFGPSMRDLPREVFRVILLNSAARVTQMFTASEGGLAASIVEPRLVFRRAILGHAASIICVHNHPSGNLEPSAEDLKITAQLVSAGRLLGINVHDHVIIAGDGYTSLAERGVIAGFEKG